jgi:hypothetical protein
MNEPEMELNALFAQARAHRPDTSKAEYAFETRLLARLRANRETSSIWAMVSWRLVPFFAVGVLALTLWQAETASEAADAASIAGLTNPVASDLLNN